MASSKNRFNRIIHVQYNCSCTAVVRSSTVCTGTVQLYLLRIVVPTPISPNPARKVLDNVYYNPVVRPIWCGVCVHIIGVFRHSLMASLFKLFLFLVHVGVDGLHSHPPLGARARFEHYIKDFNKSYTTSDEVRFAAFKRTLEEIQTLRIAQQHAQFGINEYADLTAEEREHMRCGIDKKRHWGRFGM